MTLDQLLSDAGAHIDALIDRHAGSTPPITQEDGLMTITDHPRRTGDPVRRTSRGWSVVAAAAAAIGLVVVGVAVLHRNPDETSPVDIPAPTKLTTDASIQDSRIDKVVFDGSTLWSVRTGSTFLLRMNPGTGEIVESLSLPAPATAGRAVVHDGSLYIPTSHGVVVVDTKSRQISRPLAAGTGGEVWSITFTDDGVWLCRRDLNSETLERWNGDLTERAVKVDLGAEPSFAIAGSGTTVYLATNDRGLQRYDSQGNLVATIAGIGYSYEMETDDDGTLWVADFSSGDLVAVDMATDNVVSRVAVGSAEAMSLEVTTHSNWVTVQGAQQLVVVDPATGLVTTTASLPGIPESVALADGAVWVSGRGGWALRFVPG